MKNWAKQVAGALLMLVFTLAIGGFVMVLRAQQSSLASTLSAAHIRAVTRLMARPALRTMARSVPNM